MRIIIENVKNLNENRKHTSLKKYTELWLVYQYIHDLFNLDHSNFFIASVLFCAQQ